MLLIGRLTILMSLAFASVAHATLITETFEGFADGPISSDALPGLIISAADGGTPSIVTASDPVVPGQPKGIYNDTSSAPFESALIFDFVGIGMSIGALVDFGEIGPGLRLAAYDGPGGTGNQLATTTTLTDGDLLQITGATNIKSVIFSKITPDPLTTTWLLDNLVYEFESDVEPPDPVSLPTTLPLLLLALGGLAWSRRQSASSRQNCTA